MSEKPVRKSFRQLLSSLRGTLQAGYKLVPSFIIIATLLSTGVVYVTLKSTKLMVGVVLLVVLAVAIIVYASTSKYGEAALALVAGLLTAYSVTWTPSRFIAFIAVWLTFSFFALIISSVRIAAQQEDIYRQASLALADNVAESPVIEAQLKQIGQHSTYATLGPIQRAEAIRLFVFRRIPLEFIGSALNAVETLSVITDIDHKTISAFVADIYKVFDSVLPDIHQGVTDHIYLILRRSAVPPIDFIRAFGYSRWVVLSRILGPLEYFEQLKEALESGVAPETVGDYFRNKFE